MYRSFVTCDDPKGVVECGTIRKSKVASHRTEDKLQNHRRDSYKTSKREKEEKMVPRVEQEEEDYPGPSPSTSFQLLEVSRGAQKLNQLIDSWSRGFSYEASRGQPKDVAKELLKGALDLQDSLTMLGKLQEASHYVSKLNKKKKKLKEELERTDPRRFGGYNDPRFSADGSSADSSIEELRNAIRDGFARQNVLANGKRMDSDSCVPSTSSSHSTTDSFMSQTALQQKKGKAPNLIAKLMGLEDVPSEPLMNVHHKQLDMENKKLRTHLDVEMAKVRKKPSEPVPNKVDSHRTTLEEILETTHCTGLRRGNSVKELKSYSHQPIEFHSRRKSVDDVHPIVLMKPLRVPCFDPEEAVGPIVRGDGGGLDSKMMLRRMRIRRWLDPESLDHKEVTPKASRMHFETEHEEIPNERIIREEGAKDHMNVALSPEEKEVRTVNQRAVNVNKMPRKLEAEKAPVKRHSHEERAKEHKEKEAKKKRRDSSPSKADATNLAAHKQMKEETTTDKKVDKVQKVVTSSRKQVERESLKSKKNVSKSEDQTNLTSTKLRKSGNESITTDEHASQQRSSTRKPISKNTTQTKVNSSKDRKPKEKQTSDHTAAAIPVPEILECKEEEKRIDENHSEKKESAITHVNEPFVEEHKHVLEFRAEEHCGHSIVTSPMSEYGEDIRSSNEAEDEKMTEISIDATSYKGENQLKTLLFSDPTFINLAEELFHINPSHPKISPPSTINDDIKITSDYAKEFIERRSHPDSQTRRHPLLLLSSSSMLNPRTTHPLSIDQLVDEVRSGVEALESYRKVVFNEVRVDSIYGLLDRDMRCRGVVSGIWDIGWRNGFSVDEVEQSVNDLEKLFVSELIEEVLFC